MDPISILLLLAALGGIGIGVFRRFRVNPAMTYEERLKIVLEYVPVAVAAVEQLFKGKTYTDKAQFDNERKQYAISLIATYAKQFGIEISEDVMTLVVNSIEAAVNKLGKK